mmetsp:Transcript_27660/g.85712  ORF Transcript_27660/g.85712 Transcript_27660/m.85712 type:complete len:216 (-) Transcript_27660:1324-1971(-)
MISCVHVGLVGLVWERHKRKGKEQNKLISFRGSIPRSKPKSLLRSRRKRCEERTVVTDDGVRCAACCRLGHLVGRVEESRQHGGILRQSCSSRRLFLEHGCGRCNVTACKAREGLIDHRDSQCAFRRLVVLRDDVQPFALRLGADFPRDVRNETRLRRAGQPHDVHVPQGVVRRHVGEHFLGDDARRTGVQLRHAFEERCLRDGGAENVEFLHLV